MTTGRRHSEDSYHARIAKGLDRAYRRADTKSVEISELRTIVFSDHHRGQGDGADDFRRCEPSYCAALGWYLQEDFHLWLLGDVEELWENRPDQVMARYEYVLGLERQFGKRLWRFFGNHDMAWRRSKNVRRFLRSHAPDTPVWEALRLTVTDGGVPLGALFLVHGHQGTIDSGNLLVVPFSRFIVRFGWGTLQRARGFANTSPASDAVLRGKHDRAMAAWSDAHPDRIVLVAGHTHRPVFPGKLPLDPREGLATKEAAYRTACETGTGVASARAELELAKVRLAREEPHEPIDLKHPSYFNTGCCSFGDGDVTGLEFCDGHVRLVRWLDNEGGATAVELAKMSLRDVFDKVPGGVPSGG